MAQRVSFVKPVAASFRASILLTWAGTAAMTALVLQTGATLDRLRGGRPIGGGLIAGLVAAALVRCAASAAIPMVTFRATAGLETWLRDRIWRHILRLGAPLRSEARTGSLVHASTEGVESAATFHASFLGPAIGSMTSPIIVIAAIAIFIDPWPALFLSLALPIIPLTVRVLQSRFSSVSARYRAAGGRLAARFLDALQGLPTLKLFNAAEAHGDAVATESEALRRETMRLLAVNQVVLLAVDALFSLGMITVAAVTALLRLRSGALTPGEAVALVLLSLQLVEPMERIGQFFYVGVSGRAATREIRELLGRDPEVPGGAGAPPPDADASIELDDVVFGYAARSDVLRGVSLRVEPGRTVALVGPSGAGKSTIAALIQRQRDPSTGVVRVGGHDVRDVPLEWLRSRIAVVGQTAHLFAGTIRENLLIARPDATDDDLRTALRDAHLPDVALDATVGERGLTLSGGEAQRLAIARALLKDAPILLLDEPTSNVDLESEAKILAALDRLTAGRTVLVIAHRPSTVRNADRIAVLKDGRIAVAAQRSRR